jgi:predicted alpha/beta hydrolase family esterase
VTDLILPGLYGSGPDHWQTWWLGTGRPARLVAQDDWEYPRLEDWRRRAIASIEKSPGAILVAHSLACSLVAQLAAWRGDLPIGGALLVAPADVDELTWMTPPVASFGPMPLQRLPFPSVVVASRNDPYVAFERAQLFARAWGGDFVDIGDKGHVNGESGLGPWPGGIKLAERLDRRLRALRRAG